MRRFLLSLGLILLGSAALFAQASSNEQTVQFKTIQHPNSLYTDASGINRWGSIVGTYVDADYNEHGYLLIGNNFISIDFPGAVWTDAYGINAEGDIVGVYGDPTVDPYGSTPASMKGYLLRHGTFSTVLFPGHKGSIAERITDDGDIYGCYHDDDLMASMHGFVRTKKGFVGLKVPDSMSNGATPDGDLIVGLYTDMATTHRHGFALRSGKFMPFDVPNSTLTAAWDINLDGDIVGNFRDSASKTHGFLLRHADFSGDNAANNARTLGHGSGKYTPPSNNTFRGDFSTIDFPAAVATQAVGINPDGDIVGAYQDASGNVFGYLRSATGESHH